MERLTNSIDFCQMHCDFGRAGGCFFKDKSHCYDNNMYNRLREYEDAEEQGLLLRLPVAIGTTVYKFEPFNNNPTKYIETIITRYDVYGDTVWFCFANGLGRNILDFGKTVFLTKEEAEQALKQMGE